MSCLTQACITHVQACDKGQRRHLIYLFQIKAVYTIMLIVLHVAKRMFEKIPELICHYL